jgi:hypothetical protein
MTASLNPPGQLVFPPDNRVEPGSFVVPPRPFPPSVRSVSVDAGKVAADTVRAVNDALRGMEYATLTSLFLEDGYWRDHLCLAWELRTIKGREKIRRALQEGCRVKEIEVDASSPFRTPQIAPLDALGEVNCLRFYINVFTEVGPGRGVVRLVEIGGAWQVLTFFTTLRGLTGHEEPLGHWRVMGVEHRAVRDGRNWLEKRQASANMDGLYPVVLIIGGFPHVLGDQNRNRRLTCMPRGWPSGPRGCRSAQDAQCGNLGDRQKCPGWR